MTTIYGVIVFEDFDMYAKLFETEGLRNRWINGEGSDVDSYRFFEYEIEDEYADIDLGFGQSLT